MKKKEILHECGLVWKVDRSDLLSVHYTLLGYEGIHTSRLVSLGEMISGYGVEGNSQQTDKATPIMPPTNE